MPGLSKHFIFGGLLLGLIYSAAHWTSYAPPRFHTPQEIQTFYTNSMLEVIDSNVIFPTSKACMGCHGYDENGYASVDLAFMSMMNYFTDHTVVLVDVLANTAWAACIGAVVGLVLGSGKKAAA